MGSLVVKLDKPTQDKLENRFHYSDIDMLTFRGMGDGNVPVVYDVQAVKTAVRNILMWRVGESILHPGFGHNLKRSMYSQMTEFNQDAICEEIKRALEENEPRISVVSVATKQVDDDSSNALNVQVAYKVIGNKTKDAKIVEQATIRGL